MSHAARHITTQCLPRSLMHYSGWCPTLITQHGGLCCDACRSDMVGQLYSFSVQSPTPLPIQTGPYLSAGSAVCSVAGRCSLLVLLPALESRTDTPQDLRGIWGMHAAGSERHSGSQHLRAPATAACPCITCVPYSLQLLGLSFLQHPLVPAKSVMSV
jgi:hypothetical protein